MPEKPIALKLRENLKALREQGAPKERMDEEIAYWQTKIDAQNKADRKLSVGEQIGGGVQNVMQGVTFGFSDEIAKALGSSEEEQNLGNRQIEENPALGYGLQIAGGLITPPVLKLAKGAKTLAKIGTTLGEGAIQGGLAGIGAGEGDLIDRVKAGASGAGIGSAIAGGVAGVTKGIPRLLKAGATKAGLTVPNLSQSLSGKSTAPTTDYLTARGNVDRLEKLGLADKATLADVHPQGEGALRAAATANKSVRKETDAFLGNRSNELANRADDAYSTATGAGREGADKSIADYVAARKTAAAPLYEQALQEGRAFDELANTMGKTPSKAFAKKAKVALNDPDVQRAIASVKQGPTNRTVQRGVAHRHEVMDAAYKQLNQEYGAAKRAHESGMGGAAALREMQGLNVARKKLRDAIVERAPTYADALETFSDDSDLIGAFEKGSKAAKRDPSLIASDVTEAAGEGTGDALRKGHAAAFRDLTVPNIDLAEFARQHSVTNPIKTKDAAARFKSAFGEDAYNQYKDQLLGMAELMKMKAGKGESTTIDKLIEQADTDPFALAQIVGMLSTGNVSGAAPKMLQRMGNTLESLTKRSGAAAKNAQQLRAQPGASGLRALLDQLQDEATQAQIPVVQRGALNRLTKAGSRVGAGAGVAP